MFFRHYFFKKKENLLKFSLPRKHILGWIIKIIIFIYLASNTPITNGFAKINLNVYVSTLLNILYVITVSLLSATIDWHFEDERWEIENV